MKLRPNWIRHGFLNTLELGFTRVSDALLSVVLLLVLSPESFSKLALAQAAIAPVLLIFISPENVMYRDFGLWREEGPSSVAARLRAFRLFGWGKAQLALVFCVLGALLIGSGARVERFSALLWAFSLVLAPQVAGPDREFLRLSLHLRELNLITFFQKLVLLLGSAAVVLTLGSSLPALASVAVISTLAGAWAARSVSRKVLLAQGATASSLAGRSGPLILDTLSRSISGFSLWQHLSGVVIGWVQTMDLFFLGVLRLPARELGLYASALKIANFSIAVPLALSNSFLVWLGRRVPNGEGRLEERGYLLRFSALLSGGVLFQCAVLAALAPWVLALLSRGRWSLIEQETMAAWLRWILGGTLPYCAALLIGYWLLVRVNLRQVLLQVYLPWLTFSLVVYAWAAHTAGATGAAKANVAVGTVYAALNLFLAIRSFKKDAV